MTRVITVAREYGSGGSIIAEKIADRLQWRIIDDPFIARLAEAARTSAEAVRCCDETVDPWFHKMFKAIWRGGFEGALTRPDSDPLDADAVAELWRRAISEAGQAGQCVTVGRGGQCILKDQPEVFHVYVYGPADQRVERIRDREPAGSNLYIAAAERDRRRCAYIRHYFDEDWRNPHLYNLMLNSSLGLGRCVDLILRAAELG